MSLHLSPRFFAFALVALPIGCVPSSDSSGAGGAMGVPCPPGGCSLAAGCTDDKDCASGHCADGVCCDAACDGACVACVGLKTGAANGACAAILVGTDPDGECGGSGCIDGRRKSAGACDGLGTCVAGNVTADCAPYTCAAGGKNCATSCATDDECVEGFSCSQASQTCVSDGNNGKPCAAASDCSSGFCVDGVCCNLACEGACDACAKAKGASVDGACTVQLAGSVGEPVCGAFACDGKAADCPTSCADDTACASINYCSGGACIAKKPEGDSCGGSGECVGGNCSDGVCCDKPCAGACDVCAKSLGASKDGACTLVPKGSAGEPSCAPYVCNGKSGSCGVSCIADGDCASGAFCAGVACQKKSSNGAKCTATKECSSGLCVDGVCCNEACGAQCKACNVKGAEGTCSFVPNGTDPGAECLGHCDGAGICAAPNWTSDFVEIAAEKCGPCHTMGNAGGTNFAAVYADSQLASNVCLGMNVAECSLVRIKDGSMPKGKGCTGDPVLDAANMACLTAFEQSVVEAWVNSGQPK